MACGNGKGVLSGSGTGKSTGIAGDLVNLF